MKRKVRETAAFPIETHNDFLRLVDAIESALNEHMSESTLERLWNYSTRKREAVSLRTLNVLSQFVGAGSWEEFVAQLKATAKRESEEFKGSALDVASLKEGCRIRLSWLPDRQVEVVYLGNSVSKSPNPAIPACVPGTASPASP